MDTKGSFPYVQNSSDTDSQPPIPADYSPKFDDSKKVTAFFVAKNEERHE